MSTIVTAAPHDVPRLLSLPVCLAGFEYAGSRRWLVGTSTGLLRSDDDAETWIAETTPVEGRGDVAVLSVAWSANPSPSHDVTIFAGLNGAVLRSEDAGGRWTIHRLPGPPAVVSQVALLRDGSGHAMAATTDDGVFVTTDNGESWTAWNFGLYDPNVLDLVLVSSRLAIAATGIGLFASRTGGRSWNDLDFPQAAGHVERLASTRLEDGTQVVAAGTGGAGVWISRTDSLAWVQLAEHPQGSPVNDLWLGSSDDGGVFIISAVGTKLWWTRIPGIGSRGDSHSVEVGGVATCVGVVKGDRTEVPTVMVGTAQGSVFRIREMEDERAWEADSR